MRYINPRLTLTLTLTYRIVSYAEFIEAVAVQFFWIFVEYYRNFASDSDISY